MKVGFESCLGLRALCWYLTHIKLVLGFLLLLVNA